MLAERELLPFIDMAYQGFAADIDSDAYGIRHIAKQVPEMVVTNSCSKNFGLYRDRVGSLSVLGEDASGRDVVASQVSNVVRTMYSVPPDHGAAVVAIILGDEKRRAGWLLEVKTMRDRLREMRSLLGSALADAAPDHDFSHLTRANGMFCFLGIGPEQVAQLKQDYAIYMVDSSRINVAGVTADNVDYLARSVASVL